MNNIDRLKVELAINTAALEVVTAFEERLELLTQRATLKDLLINALSEALTAAQTF